MPMGGTGFRLDAAQRSVLERLVRACGVKDWGKALSGLKTGVEGSIVAWSEFSELRVTPQGVVLVSGLVALLTKSSQPIIGLIRTRVAALLPGIVREIEGRALRLSNHGPGSTRIVTQAFRAKVSRAMRLFPRDAVAYHWTSDI